MAGKIFNIQDDGGLVEMQESGFVTEDDFQSLLERYPGLLAGDQIRSDDPRRWLLVKREMGIAGGVNTGDRWSLDHLFIDQDGIPTLVEVKRSTDTRLRREVVGQVLDYAANAVVYWSLDKIKTEFERQCERDNIDADEQLNVFLGDDADTDEFWQQVKTNLQAGRVRLLFVADVIPPELRRIVEFLNSQMDPAEVLAVEIRHYVGQGMKTLVPRVIGQTAEAEAKKRGANTPKPRLTEDVVSRLAKDAGKGPLYQAFVAHLKQRFDVDFYGNGICFCRSGPGQELMRILAFYPGERKQEAGLVTQVWIDSFSQSSDCSREEVIQKLEELHTCWGQPHLPGGIAKMLIGSVEELNQILGLLEP